MLVRAYRFTDKLGVVFLKSSIALVDTTLDGLSMIWRRIAVVLAFIGGILWLVLRPIVVLFGLLFGCILRQFWHPNRTQKLCDGFRFDGAAGGARADGGWRRRRPAARAESRAEPADGGAAGGAGRRGAVGDQSRAHGLLRCTAGRCGVVCFAAAPTSAAILQSTPVPTTTPLPPILEARGTMAYVVRELGADRHLGSAGRQPHADSHHQQRGG